MQNDQNYWEKQFSNCVEIRMKLAQANFFYKTFKKLFPLQLQKEINIKNSSCCDFGCGLGNFTSCLHEIFPNVELYGVDYSKNAISYGSKHFQNVKFINTSLDNLNKNFDIMVTSNTLEHFSNPDKIMKQLLSHTNKIFMMLVPYEEMELYQEHLFSFQKSFFKRNVNDFELIYLKSIDLSCSFNTMWLGKQVLAIYKAKNFVIDFAEDIEDIHIEKLTFINKINYKINLFRRNGYRFVRKLLTKYSKK